MQHLKTIEKLLKNEISATETYQQALDKFKEEAGLGGSEALMPLFEEHKDAVASLEALTTRFEGEPTESSGAWGAWAKIILGTANLLGKEAVLKALLEGEKSGADDYKSALEEVDLLADIRALIEEKLLPAQHAHIQALEQLLETEAA
jgi:glycogen debranching enzyme